MTEKKTVTEDGCKENWHLFEAWPLGVLEEDSVSSAI